MLPDWFKSYRAHARRYDELRDRDGAVREHWRALIERLGAQGQEAAAHGVELARSLVAENGVTYNVYADAKGADRPWVLDPLPVILTAPEWREIERGVQQRATLIDAVLTDLYGPQHMLAEGIIPPELAFGHPNYLWPCRGIRPMGGRWLPLYAVDLARAPDGRWWVLGDRAQAPSGAGYALENRQIVGRLYPELIRDLGVRHITPYFVALREQLLNAAGEGETPLVVVLTPGAFNETYFEHAYLARQLGLLLVEGHDLTVRNDTVYLKTLAGLRRVHAILRRLDDDYCDPVELRSDSALGVPGLLQAVRAGRVMLANPLGSGVMESAAWMGFLPGVAEWLFNEKLSMPSVATWWCGERPALEYVQRHLERLVIKPTYPNQRFEVIFGKELSEPDRQELMERMRKRPHAFVAQERFGLSQMPAWRDTQPPRLIANAVTIRVYAVATDSGYVVLPGGLARIAGETSAEVVSNQRGGGSKDVWVLPEVETPGGDARSILPRVAIRHAELPSSMGENLFWLGRYNERCENKVRLARATLSVRVFRQLWESALTSCRQFGLFNDAQDLRGALFDAADPASIAADCKRLNWCATQVRGRLSLEHWRTLSVLRRQVSEAATGHASHKDLRETLDWLLLSLAASSGFSLDDMNQDDGWRLMILGRRLERLQFYSELLAGKLSTGLPLSQGELEWLLDISGCTIAYRTRYVASARLPLVLDLLLRDHGNPRAMAYQRETIRLDLLRLAESFDAAADNSLGRPMAAVMDTDFGVLEGEGQGASYARQSLAVRLEELSKAVSTVSDDLALRHFSHVEREMHAVAT